MRISRIFHKLSDKISLSKDTSKELENISSSSFNQSSSTDKQKIYCRFCGKDNPAASEYCSECRTQITMTPSQVMKVCQKCGLAVNDDSVYCYSCGTKVDDAI
jgi:hypothetical protein